MWPSIVAMVPPPALAKGFAHEEIMMGNDGGASCASCVMVVVVMTVNCGLRNQKAGPLGAAALAVMVLLLMIVL